MAGAVFTRLGTYNMVLPPEGPKVYPFSLDFSADNSQLLDFTSEVQKGFVSWIQAAIIDNTLNMNDLIVSAENVSFNYRIPAGKQAFLPLFVTDAAKVTFSTTPAANLLVPVLMTNVPVQPMIY